MAYEWACFVLGLALLVITAFSVVGTLVVPRAVDSPITHWSDAFVDLLFVTATRPVKQFERRDRVLAWQGPVALLVRLGVWIGLLVVGYALVLLPFVHGNFDIAFSEAGSSMFTLGYAVPHGKSSTIVEYAAAFTGLVVVGLQIGYLPTLYSAFNRRETLVTLLISRAGIPAWGPEILARTRFGIVGGDPRPVLDELFDHWESWAAEVAESHTTYQALVRLRSPRPLSHWLTSLLAVMDAAALHLALAPNSEPRLTARLCLRMGFVAMNQIGRTLRLPVDEDPDPDGDISITKAEFAEAFEMLVRLGYPVERTVDEAWPHFRGWRVNYDGVALALARAVDAPPAYWSGSRRWAAAPIAPQRPSNRMPSS